MAFSGVNCMSGNFEKLENENNLSDSEYDSAENEDKYEVKSSFGDNVVTRHNEDRMSSEDNCSDRKSADNCDNKCQSTNGDRIFRSLKGPTSGRVKEMRNTFNRRERRRMHQLNSALDGLRDVMPSVHSASARKLSKIATLLSAKSYIQMLGKAVQDMSILLSDLRRSTAGISNSSSCLPLCAPAVLPYLPPFPSSAESVLRSPSASPGVVSYSNIREAPNTSAMHVHTVSPLNRQDYGQQHVYYTNRSPTLYYSQRGNPFHHCY